jgi:hypothetical protein
MGQAEFGTVDSSKEVALEVLSYPSRNPPPRPATSVQQATHLLEGSRALLSDLSILHDEFTSASHPSKTDVILSLTGSPHATLEPVSKLCANVDALKKRLYNRELLEKDDPRSCFISDAVVAEAATIEASTDQSLLNGLAVEYCTMRRDITMLRGYLEEVRLAMSHNRWDIVLSLSSSFWDIRRRILNLNRLIAMRQATIRTNARSDSRLSATRHALVVTSTGSLYLFRSLVPLRLTY